VTALRRVAPSSFRSSTFFYVSFLFPLACFPCLVCIKKPSYLPKAIPACFYARQDTVDASSSFCSSKVCFAKSAPLLSAQTKANETEPAQSAVETSLFLFSSLYQAEPFLAQPCIVQTYFTDQEACVVERFRVSTAISDSCHE